MKITVKKDPRLRVGLSKIKGAGKGLFARAWFRSGHILQVMDYRMATNAEANKDHKFIAWIDGEAYYVLSSARYANHSSTPNAELIMYFDGLMELRALRNINSNEEITIHYGEDWE